MKTAAALLLLALPALADELVLRNGAVLEGRIVEAGEQVMIVMDFGTATFRRAEVSRINLGSTALQEFEAKVKALDSKDVEGRHALAHWARSRDLSHRAKELFREILGVDPDHEGARRELGYVKHAGRWMTGEEVKAEQGLVLFRGAWIKRTEAEEIRRKEDDRSAAIYLEEMVRRAEKERIEAEAELLRVKAEAERVRTELEKEKRAPLFRYAILPSHIHIVAGRRVPCCCPK